MKRTKEQAELAKGRQIRRLRLKEELEEELRKRGLDPGLVGRLKRQMTYQRLGVQFNGRELVSEKKNDPDLSPKEGGKEKPDVDIPE